MLLCVLVLDTPSLAQQLPEPQDSAYAAGELDGRIAAEFASTDLYLFGGFAAGFIGGFLAPAGPGISLPVGGGLLLGVSAGALSSRVPADQRAEIAGDAGQFQLGYAHGFEARVRERRQKEALLGALVGIPLGYATVVYLGLSSLR